MLPCRFDSPPSAASGVHVSLIRSFFGAPLEVLRGPGQDRIELSRFLPIHSEPSRWCRRQRPSQQWQISLGGSVPYLRPHEQTPPLGDHAKGSNLLGKVLVRVRDRLRAGPKGVDGKKQDQEENRLAECDFRAEGQSNSDR